MVLSKFTFEEKRDALQKTAQFFSKKYTAEGLNGWLWAGCFFYSPIPF
jgi:hypothetical protein